MSLGEEGTFSITVLSKLANTIGRIANIILGGKSIINQLQKPNTFYHLVMTFLPVMALIAELSLFRSSAHILISSFFLNRNT